MRILLVCERMDSGGAETHILCLAKGLRERGHSVFVVSSGGKMTDSLKKHRIPSIVLPISYSSPIALLSCLNFLKRIIQLLHIDVVHSHTRRASLLCHYATRNTHTRFVTTIHARFDMSGIKGILSRWGERTIAVSHDLKAHLCLGSPYVAGENVTVIPNGIDTTVFAPSSIAKDGKHIVFLSRLDADCSTAAYALCSIAESLSKRFDGIHITIGGGGSELVPIKRLAHNTNKRIGKSVISVIGNVSDAPTLLASADIFVGVSRAAIEAMSCGSCVIAAGDEGFGGMVTNGNIHRLAEGNFCCRDCEKITDKSLFFSLCSLLRRSTDERADIGEFLRNYVLNNCSYKKMAQLCEGVYKSIERSPRYGKKIVLCGYYGYGNLGDDMLLRAAVRRAKSTYPRASISALTAHGKRDSDYFGISCTKRKSPLSLLLNIIRADTVIFGGGTLLQNATSRRSIWYYIAMIQLSSVLKKTIVLWGNGIGEIRGRSANNAVSTALKKCNYIGLRDKCSLNAARNLIGNDSRMHLEHDLAFGKPRLDAASAEYFLNKLGISNGEKYSIVALRNGETKDCIRKAILYVQHCTASGVFPIYVAMYPSVDLPICKKFASRFGGGVAYPCDAPTLASLICGAQEVLSMRYHALILAASCGIPYIAVGSQKKITKFGKL